MPRKPQSRRQRWRKQNEDGHQPVVMLGTVAVVVHIVVVAGSPDRTIEDKTEAVVAA